MPVLSPGNGQPRTQGSLRSLIDPKLEQTKLVRSQVLGIDLVLGRGHDGIFQMGGDLEKKTVLRIARFNERPSVVSLSNVVGGFHNGVSLRTGPGMAGQAIGPKEGSISSWKSTGLSLFTSAISSFPHETRGKRTQMVKKINLREVIMGKSAWFSAGGENGQLKRLAEFEVLVLVPEACFQGTAVFPDGSLCLRGKLDFTEALALVDILLFNMPLPPWAKSSAR